MTGKKIAIFLFIAFCFLKGDALFSAVKSSKSGHIELPEKGLCAHRGAMATHPENTLSALDAAVKVGAHMIEFDVAFTKDEHIVLMHDGTVDRTTNGSGKVSEMTFQEIRQLDAGNWKSDTFAGERVPTIDEALSILPVNIWINIHLKGSEKLAKKVAQKVLEHDRLHQCFLACGTKQARKAREAVPDILICNMDRREKNIHYVNETIAMGADFIQLRRAIYPEYDSYIKKLKDNNIRVNYFGTDNAEELKLLFDYGVDFPLTNDIISTIKVVQPIGIKPWRPEF
jgi:glycerophosphoryl diester phosphodiesterase